MKEFLQMVDNTSPHNVSANADQSMIHLVNKAYEAFLPAQSKLDKINDALDTDLQVTLVDEKKANDQLREIRLSSKQLREKENNLQGDVRETEKQVDRERVNHNEAISFAQKKKDQLEEAKSKSPLKVLGGALIGGLVVAAGPFGIIGVGVAAVAGAGVGGTVAYADIEQADKAVDEAWSAKRRAEERLESKERDLRKVKLDLEGLEKQQRGKSEELKMIERRKEEKEQRKEKLANLSGSVKRFITLVDTTTSRTEMMAKEANGELPDIAAMMVPLKAIVSDICESLTNSCLLSGHVDFSCTEIQKMKDMSLGDIDLWA